MILKPGESLVQLKLRVKKEMSELSQEDAILYRDEVVRDIFNAALEYEIPVEDAREFINSVDPEFYSKPNKLRSKTMKKIPLEILQIICLVMLIVVVWQL